MFNKTIIAMAVASAAGTAIADVKIGGKFDAGYQFKRTANSENTNGAPQAGLNAGGKTTEELGDGGASTSRLTFAAKEDLGGGLTATVDMDLRFTNVHVGTNGLNNNDKKVMGIQGPFGEFSWGTYNITNLNIAEKPYMVSPKDMEIVKFGISQARESALTNRNTEYISPTFKTGPLAFLFKANYAFGDKRTTGASNIAGQNSGDAQNTGFEATLYGQMLTFNFDVIKRASSSNITEDGMVFSHTYLTYRPDFVKGLKFSGAYNIYKGYNPNITAAFGGPAFQDKNTNFVVSYSWNDKIELGVEVSHLNDVGSNRNSGRGYMVGGAYFLSKSTYIYAARSRTDFERNETITGAKYDGTKVGFSDSLKKIDETYTRIGIVKEF